jgi:hypothetical protein
MQEESKQPQHNFTEVFDFNLFTAYLAGHYLSFDDFYLTFSRLNRQFNGYVDCKNEFLWKKLYIEEFYREKYPDMKKAESESWFEYFKRSFIMYKRIRWLLRRIVDVTNEKSDADHKQQSNYIKAFKERRPHPLIEHVLGLDLIEQERLNF